MSRYDVIVIGAGHNGLVAAGLLAKKGRRVLLLERRAFPGGVAAGETFHAGYQSAGLLHDTSLIHPSVIDALDLTKYGLAMESESPPVLFPARDGMGLLLFNDLSTAFEEIAQISPRDAEQYLAYRAFIDKVKPFINHLTEELPVNVDVLETGHLWALAKKAVALRRLGKKEMLEVLRILAMCAADWLIEWFETDLLKAGLAGPAIYGTYLGPWSPGSNFNLLRWECGCGSSVKGGPRALVRSLEKAVKHFGVELRTEAPVSEIRLKSNRVQGVTCTGGEQWDAGVVMAACDPKHTFFDLIPSQNLGLRFEQALRNYRMRGNTAAVNLALNAPLSFTGREGFPVARARTGEHLDDLEKAFDAVKYRRFSKVPVLDISIPSLTEPSLAPKGCHVVSILVHFAPYDLETGWNDDQRKELGDAVSTVLESYAPGVTQNIVAQEVLAPPDLEARYGLTQGHIHHGEHALDQLLVRPVLACTSYETPFAGLFLCGSGSRPGGGLTGLPGLWAARKVWRSEKRRTDA